MNVHYDVIVIGAGPAGATAAVTATDHGLSVLVLDEARSAGGQVYRAAGPSARPSAAAEGDSLRARLTRSGAHVAFEHRVWHVARAPAADGAPCFTVAAVGPHGQRQIQGSALIVANGAIERHYPRPGWTLPGVVGLAAATAMVKAGRIVPGRRVVVVGPGPLAPLVANLIIDAGSAVAALVDPNPLRAWVSALPAMTRRLDLLAEGAAWFTRLAVNGVPMYRGWDVSTIDGEHGVESITLRPVDSMGCLIRAGPQKTIAADAVCISYGLAPATEIYRLLGVTQRYAPQLGGWVPLIDQGQRTDVVRLYAAGDGAGVLGAVAAPFSGRIAALSAVCDLGRIDAQTYHRLTRAPRRRLARAAKFGAAMARLVAPRASAMVSVPDDTVLCRCEDICAGELRAAIAAGALELNALKAATRCGMGPCGGRVCGEAAAALMESTGIAREQIGQFTGRAPLRPVAVAALTGSFDYNDIPLPKVLDA